MNDLLLLWSAKRVSKNGIFYVLFTREVRLNDLLSLWSAKPEENWSMFDFLSLCSVSLAHIIKPIVSASFTSNDNQVGLCRLAHLACDFPFFGSTSVPWHLCILAGYVSRTTRGGEQPCMVAAARAHYPVLCRVLHHRAPVHDARAPFGMGSASASTLIGIKSSNFYLLSGTPTL